MQRNNPDDQTPLSNAASLLKQLANLFDITEEELSTNLAELEAKEKLIPNCSQRNINAKIATFLAALTTDAEKEEELNKRLQEQELRRTTGAEIKPREQKIELSPIQGGACNGYIILKAFAIFIGQENSFDDRIEFIALKSDEQLEKMATLLRNSKLSESKTSTLSTADQALLERTNDFYIFIHALLYAQQSLADQLNVGQMNLQAIAKIIGPPQLNPAAIKQPFEFTFPLTEMQLAATFENIKEGELGLVSSGKHILLIQKRDGKYKSFDSNYRTVKGKTWESSTTLAKEISSQLKQNPKKTNLSLNVFSIKDQPEARPTVHQWLSDLIAKHESSPSEDELDDALASAYRTSQPSMLAALIQQFGSKRFDFQVLKTYDKEFLSSLQEEKIDLNQSDKNGLTFLHLAATMNQHDAIQALIKAGAHINQPNHDGNTPLHHACLRNLQSLDAVQTLIDLGADLSQKNKSGQRPIDIAIDFSNAYPPGVLILLAMNKKNLGLHSGINNDDTHRGLTKALCQHIDAIASVDDKRKVLLSVLNRENGLGELLHTTPSRMGQFVSYLGFAFFGGVRDPRTQQLTTSSILELQSHYAELLNPTKTSVITSNKQPPYTPHSQK